MKPMVALDLDDIIYPFLPDVLPHLNSAFDTTLGVEDFFSYEFERVIGDVTRQQVIDVVLDYFATNEVGHPTPHVGSLDAIDRLLERYRLAIVTSREDSLREVTLAWLSAHFPDRFDDVQLCNSFVVTNPLLRRRKVDVCLEIGAVALVDDGLANVVEAAAHGMRGVLFGDFPWNRTDTLPGGVVRVLDWEAVVEELVDAAWV